MPDFKDAMKNAGLNASVTEIKCSDCGKPFVPRDPKHKRCSSCIRKENSQPTKPASLAFFEERYPDYFDEDGLLKPEYVTTKAEEIAQHLANERPKMTMHQLRSFYSHVKLQEGALESGRPFKQVLLEINKLKPFASERASKEKIPKYFEEFIKRNVDKVKDERSFSQGFVEHFQAVVAYCAGTIRR